MRPTTLDGWSPRPGSNRRPRPYQGRALPTELRGRAQILREGRDDRQPYAYLGKSQYRIFPNGRWWAGRESNPHSRRRLIYSQRSSPPAQPTHAFDRQVVRCRPTGSIAKDRSAPQPGGFGRYPRLDGQRGQALSIRKRVPSAVQRRIGHRLSPRFTRVSASRAATSTSSTNDTGMRRSCRCRIRIAYSRLPATSAERPSASASSGISGTLRRPAGACLVRKWSCPAVGPGLDDGRATVARPSIVDERDPKNSKEPQAQEPGITTSTLMSWPTCPVP
jgi:hypothetical protein